MTCLFCRPFHHPLVFPFGWFKEPPCRFSFARKCTHKQYKQGLRSGPKASRVGGGTSCSSRASRHIPRSRALNCGRDHPGLQSLKDTWTRDGDAKLEPQEHLSISSKMRAPTSNPSVRSTCGHNPSDTDCSAATVATCHPTITVLAGRVDMPPLLAACLGSVMGCGCLPRFHYRPRMPAQILLWAADACLGSVMGCRCPPRFHYGPRMPAWVLL